MLETTIRHYLKQPNVKKIKRPYKFTQKYIDQIYQMPSNETTMELTGGLIELKINNNFKSLG